MDSSNISQAELTSKLHLDLGRSIPTSWGHAVAEHTTSLKVSVSITDGSFEFFIDINPPSALWSWGRLSLQQTRVPGIFPGG